MVFWNDVRFALRQFRKSPAFTLVVLATLALCIGANTAVYSVLDAVLLRAAPYPEPDRLALVATAYRQNGKEDLNDSQTGSLFEVVRDRATSLDCAAYAGWGGVNFAVEGRIEYIQQQRVSAGFFRVMGVAPQFGREFTRQEDVPNGAPVVVLSYGFWRRVFHGDLGVLGRGINLKGEPYTVVGIMPRDFRGTAPIDVWTPLRPTRTGEGAGSNYGVVARLLPGVTWAAASDQLKALSQGLKGEPGFPRETSDFEERIIPLQSGVTSSSRSQLLVAWAAVLIVLLIGCVNIAGLLMARSGARSREIATRMAVGGSRLVILRQLLVESLLLALGGGAAGIGLGAFAIDSLKHLDAEYSQSWHPIQMDIRVMAAMMGIAVLTSLVFGLAPALQTTRIDIRSVLIEGGRGMAGGRRRWTRNALVAAEVALSLVLLVSAGLMAKTLAYFNGLTPGFDTRNVIAAEASLQDARYTTSEAVNKLFSQSLDQIRQIPGVRSAAVALTLPYERPLNYGFRILDGDDGRQHGMEFVYVTPEYFEAMRIPVLGGRGLLASDTPQSTHVALVSQAFAAKWFHGGQAAGHHLKVDGNVLEIVGTVGDVQQHSGLSRGLGPMAIEPTVYVPAAQTSDGFLRVHVWFSPKWMIRSSGSTGNLTAQVQRAVAAVDSQLPIAGFKTVDDLQGRYTRDQRYLATLFSILAGMAVLLAAIGLYGLISQSITQRTHELGIRLALGATPPQTMAAIVKPGIVLALAGVAAGYALSRVAVRFLESLLWGVRPTDLGTFVTMAAILLLVAALASLAPALRILRMDPAQTLRSE
ncbi:MAG TPA: ABC transporter permease [Candidatus Acidoferrales bacterium]|nr:ABC transporter permease [Candidatus Acidoferrales bacterium]